MNCFTYRWEKDYRYYEAHLEQDLYGWVIIRTWGRKQTRRGRDMKVRVDSYPEGLKELKHVKKCRRKRGYTCIRSNYEKKLDNTKS